MMYIGSGACIRKPDDLTRLHMSFDNEGQVFYERTGLNGTMSVAGNTTQTATNARFGNCGYFDGTGDWIDFSVKTGLDPLHQLGEGGVGNAKFSISFWFKPLSWTPTTQFILDNHNSATSRRGITVYFNNTPRLYLKINNGTAAVASIAFDLGSADTNLHYYVITYDHSLSSGNCNMYRDGGSLGTAGDKTGAAPTTSTSTYAPCIGASASAHGSPLNGYLDELVVKSGIIIDGTKVPTRKY